MLPSYAEFSTSAPLSPAFFSKTLASAAPQHRRDLNKFGCHTPYDGVNGSEDDSSDQGMSLPPSPSNVHCPPRTPKFAENAPPMNTVHVSLWGRCELIQTPEIAPVECPTPVNAFPLFLGQVRFETTPADLRWILRRVANVLALKCELRGNGCFIVYLKSSADADAVRRLHKRLLFDHSGVWFARNEREVDVLFDYANNTLPFVSRRCHLPRDCMVVEEVKTYAHEASSPASPFFSASSRGNSTTSFGTTPPSPPPYVVSN